MGGALTGIGLPTNNAVRSIFNKWEIRKNGWSGAAAKSYEEYWYGANGFGDTRNKQVSNGEWKTEIENALKEVRSAWGKENLGKGLESKLDSFIKQKNLCNGSSGSGSGTQCRVGNIEFIDDKGNALYGRIPIEDNNNKKSNLYVKWLKCTKNTAKASAVWVGRVLKQEESSHSTSSSSNGPKWNWCIEVKKK
ncbi:hypothetical protein [Candidatus Mycoplasma haematominutum]|uniref:Uncharacterized protein n=1 Tax=Candidatus Mycoplasma haematominutum 'Birmingham 1' TaxID=1116213 RepID=G8C2S3_9MOLU|nr:hypothetical protein [Candidatus Mycoplasma haematominutum]CCE66621.1 hypothetical protein MHM_01030 [Candidatus Mycoplasma haematominutum 'Birmingham 1']